jgi:hypothetical protein
MKGLPGAASGHADGNQNTGNLPVPSGVYPRKGAIAVTVGDLLIYA